VPAREAFHGEAFRFPVGVGAAVTGFEFQDGGAFGDEITDVLEFGLFLVGQGAELGAGWGMRGGGRGRFHGGMFDPFGGVVHGVPHFFLMDQKSA
jgi:hypothetical protein